MKKRVTALLLAVLLISLLTVPASAAETSWLWPVESCTSITPGRDYNGSEHNGIDIPGAYGAAIRASKSGTVDTVYSGCINHNAYSAGGQTCTSVGLNGFFAGSLGVTGMTGVGAGVSFGVTVPDAIFALQLRQ